ncbi:MAG: phage holin family protein [Limnochordales bacterium]|nr:phage holin family protein [Limnochordales bacterium]
MPEFLWRWLLNGIGLLITVRLVGGLHVDSIWTGLLAGAVLGIVNAVIRPVLVFLSFPFTLITLGLFTLVINGLMLWLTAALVPGFRIVSFGAAIVGALVLSLVSWVLSWFLPG